MKADPIAWTRQSQWSISRVRAAVRVLSTGCLKWQVRSRSPDPFGFFCSDFQHCVIKVLSYCIQKKKWQIKPFPKRPRCSRAEEGAWIHRGLGRLSSATSGLQPHRWAVCEVIKCSGRWNDSQGEELAMANKALSWQRKWKLKHKLTGATENIQLPSAQQFWMILNEFNCLQKEVNVLTWIST